MRGRAGRGEGGGQRPDRLGRDDFGPAVAALRGAGQRRGARAEAGGQGERVRVERSTVYDLSEAQKETRFSDYSRIPEFELTEPP